MGYKMKNIKQSEKTREVKNNFIYLFTAVS